MSVSLASSFVVEMLVLVSSLGLAPVSENMARGLFVSWRPHNAGAIETPVTCKNIGVRNIGAVPALLVSSLALAPVSENIAGGLFYQLSG